MKYLCQAYFTASELVKINFEVNKKTIETLLQAKSIDLWWNSVSNYYLLDNWLTLFPQRTLYYLDGDWVFKDELINLNEYFSRLNWNSKVCSIIYSDWLQINIFFNNSY